MSDITSICFGCFCFGGVVCFLLEQITKVMAGIFDFVCWCSARLCKLTFRQPYYRNPLLH